MSWTHVLRIPVLIIFHPSSFWEWVFYCINEICSYHKNHLIFFGTVNKCYWACYLQQMIQSRWWFDCNWFPIFATSCQADQEIWKVSLSQDECGVRLWKRLKTDPVSTPQIPQRHFSSSSRHVSLLSRVKMHQQKSHSQQAFIYWSVWESLKLLMMPWGTPHVICVIWDL